MITRINNARLSFPNLFKPTAFGEGQEPAFNATFLISKTDPQVAAIQQVIEAVATEKWGAKAPAILKSILTSGKCCFRDGADKAQYNGFDGQMYLSARSASAPKVFDRDRSDLSATSGRPYAGCFVNVSIDIWAQDNKYGKRINATLRGVQFVKDGEAFGGSAPARAEEFDDVSDIGDDLV